MFWLLRCSSGTLNESKWLFLSFQIKVCEIRGSPNENTPLSSPNFTRLRANLALCWAQIGKNTIQFFQSVERSSRGRKGGPLWPDLRVPTDGDALTGRQLPGAASGYKTTNHLPGAGKMNFIRHTSASTSLKHIRSAITNP